MTVDIKFGKLTTDDDGDETCIWPGDPIERDGTSKEHTIFAGKPIRSCPYAGFAEWTARDPFACVLSAICWNEERQITRLDDTLMKIIAGLSKDKTRIDSDRARWFQYWSVRAREEFGDQAVIYFW